MLAALMPGWLREFEGTSLSPENLLKQQDPGSLVELRTSRPLLLPFAHISFWGAELEIGDHRFPPKVALRGRGSWRLRLEELDPHTGHQALVLRSQRPQGASLTRVVPAQL